MENMIRTRQGLGHAPDGYRAPARRGRRSATRSAARAAARSDPRAARPAPAAAARRAPARRAAAARARPARDRGCRAGRPAARAPGPARRPARAPRGSGPPPAAGPPSAGRPPSGGLALEVRDLLGLGVGLAMRLRELLLGLALALLLAPLAVQRGIVGEVSGGLLDAAADLVLDAHGVPLPQRRPGQPLAQVDDRREHDAGAGLDELAVQEAAGEHGDRLDVGVRGRLAVEDGVAHHDGRAAADLLEGAVDEVRRGLRVLHVARRRPRVGELTRVEQVEVVLDLVGLRRAGEHDAVVGALEVLDEAARAVERADLLDQLEVALLLGVADVVALALLDL